LHFLREGHRVAPSWILLESHTTGRRPRDHETLHHVAVLELVPDGVRVVWLGLLEESLEVVVRWPRLTLVTVGSSHDSPYVGATRLPIVAIIILGHGHSLLRTFFAPPLATLDALPSTLDGNI
jgi:hypothetical protein